MQILNNVSLRPYNTFGIDARASFFAFLDDSQQVEEIITRGHFSDIPRLLLGGGSNILFTKNFDGLVLRIGFKGIKHEFINGHQVLVTSGAGENWDDLVQFCVNRGWGGIENLSLIPGSVGAAPIQNIGAYGVELKDGFSHLEALDLTTFEMCRFTLSECNFAYRNSVFKNELKNRYLITSVSLLLSTKPTLNLTYPALRNELEKTSEEPDIKSVAEAVIRIRRSKLPDPEELGNAGSFFKNPVLSAEQFQRMQSEFPKTPSFIQDENFVKVPAAWLIEQCGWKGKRSGDAGVHVFQPLVLVNYGKASGSQILDLADQIRESVFLRFNIILEPEVNII